MKFLLINTNQIVQKLVEITAKKAGADLTTIKDSSEMGDLGQYDYIIIDDDCLNLDKNKYLDALKDKRKCLIHNKQAKRMEGFDDYVQKPFLPTSILDVFTAQLANASTAPLQTPATENVAETPTESPANVPDQKPISLDNLDDGLGEIDSILEEDQHLDTPETQDDSQSQESDTTDDKNASSREIGFDLEEVIDETKEDAPKADEGLDVDLDFTNFDKLQNPAGDDGSSAGETEEAIDLSNPTEDKNTNSEEIGFDLEEVIDETKEDAPKADEGLDVDLDFTNFDKLQNPAGDDGSSAGETEEATASEEINLEDDSALGEEADLSLDISADSEFGTSAEEFLSENIGGDAAQGGIPPTDPIPMSDELNEEIEALNIPSVEDAGSDSAESTEDALDAGEEELSSENDLLDDAEELDLSDTGDSESDSDTGDGDSEPVQDDENLDTLADEETSNESDALDESAEDIESTDIAESDACSADSAEDSETSESTETPQDTANDETSSEETPPKVLDSEQVSEVAQALDALDESAESTEKSDFVTLKEPEVAQALGEEIEGYEEEDNAESAELDEDPVEKPNAQSADKESESAPIAEKSPANNEASSTGDSQEAQIVKNMIASSVQSGISSLSSSNLKSMLDGLEVTINISFKDKSK